ncbi:alpha-1,4-glucan:maltose-1-phosphate maltosyltransferase 2 [Variibacter gotjawalensis]|uniref:Alpha-1,4-glucan:maltose-1-phosphate maltosyltransferase n=1 Tax=Variibacter gotjawalensis TaxID=1333996 RepID=A0A0S3PUJ0_9BRAD|nr:alpha-1,4-glucan--maltose-1-phosphate maltosyltransferase [Variibacter gotjawalensis]NIK49963.1 starch synthase (maltosyl-transferring) [Variibacter gotjawalensis]RZS45962.1 alpha-1,4-glucan:maltose-1-phosphate maltosyltransferase [Variibacter gotjawalensis]BAT59637.1 alpha-1,4-glucan:maltose-1-phosphate maltosyltransferase 2 [Variibacter gotjawalensis]
MKHEPRPRLAGVPAGVGPDVEGARFFIEEVYPIVDGGKFPVKRIAGESIDVWADVFRDGHDVTVATLLWSRAGDQSWRRVPMQHDVNDRWHAAFAPPQSGQHQFAIEAWTDSFATWRRGYLLKAEAGQASAVDADEGRALLTGARYGNPEHRAVVRQARETFDQSRDATVLLTEELAEAMAGAQPRPDLTWSRAFPLTIDRAKARASAWYEIFPRSQSKTLGQHGTFDDCIARLPDIAEMGFDVLYFPPIHPIGTTNRKGKNNSLTAGGSDPGSPYAIGGEAGGHDALHPELGNLDDFRRLVAACHEYGLEVALDFATQCSPDHPWLKNHPEWFRRRPDGTIKYAENPPKKYQDIHNPDFYCVENNPLWTAFRDVIQFWVDQGVKIFRVDNPHTKPFPFWRWLIADIQSRDPDVIFLSEAFTRPKVMKALAKLGFSQSYTYFTWRETKAEFSEYMADLTKHPEREFYRPNFFVNTPDILPKHLQTGERWMFVARAALAATLSSSYGVYSGFELIEHAPLGPGKEEYLDSEKYEIRVRDWNAPGNIRGYFTYLNRIRRENPALLQTSNFRFVNVDDGEVLGFLKDSFDGENAVACAIALTHRAREFWMHFGDMQIGPPNALKFIEGVENLATGERRMLEWGGVRLRLDPEQDPALIFRCF